MNHPVIVGVGQYTDRDATAPYHPVKLMDVAVRQAFADAGLSPQHYAAVDSLDVINVLSWRYQPNAAHALAEAVGLRPRHCEESPIGGEQPVALLDALSARLASGTTRFGIICGAEAQATLTRSKVSGERLPWPPLPELKASTGTTVKEIVNPELWRHGLRFPIQIYPLFENAYRASRGQTLDQAQTESAAIWATMSTTAADNPYAWYRSPRTALDIKTPSPDNRWIHFPYTKLMNAAPNVNQAAAIVVTTEDHARELGIFPDKFIYPVSAAGAYEVADPLQRPAYDRSDAMRAALVAALTKAELTDNTPELLEIYSCFPVVPKLARTYLRLRDETSLSVAGGLSFFGGPGNNYMVHGIAALTEMLRRSHHGSTALAFGQGEFVTKHYAAVLSNQRPAGPYLDGFTRLPEQDRILRDRFSRIRTAPRGDAVIETYTASWQNGVPRAIIVGRLVDTGERFVARTDPVDTATAEELVSGEQEGVGGRVRVSTGDDGNVFTLTHR